MQNTDQVSPDDTLRIFVLTQPQAQFLQKLIADEINLETSRLGDYKYYMNKHYEKSNKDLKDDPKVKVEFAQYSDLRKQVKKTKKRLERLREIQYNIKRVV